MSSIIQSFFAVFAAIELYLSKPCNDSNSSFPEQNNYSFDNKRFPDLKLNRRSQNIFCGPNDAHLRTSGFALMVLLLESSDGTVSFDDSCDETYLKNRKCPWRLGLATAQSSRRSAASRLSTVLWEAEIPYKVMYSEVDGGVFILIPNSINADVCRKIPITVTTTHKIFETGVLLDIKKSLKSLKTQARLLQKYQYHELAEPSSKISPVLNELPIVNSPQGS